MNPIELEQRYGARNYNPLPVILSHGHGAIVYDISGKRYVDCMAGYSAVSHGHGHPRIRAALNIQAGRLAVPSRAYYNNKLGLFLRELCAITGLDLALPCSGGAEAVETAIKAARRWGYQVKGIEYDAQIIVADGNFHGRTTTIVGFSSEGDYRAGFGPFTPGFISVPFGNLNAIKEVLRCDACSIAAVLIEPIQGEAGIIVPPEGYFKDLRKLCRDNDVLLILDEVQSGLGRTGKMFAYEHEGIKPDGVILGKALGGGMLPVSALVGTRDLMSVFTPGSHGSTFGGSPLAAAVGLEAINVLRDEKLVERSAELGAHLHSRLAEIASHCDAVKATRGRGLWAGLELTPEYDAREICIKLIERGVLTKDTHKTVLRFAPPLVIEQAELDFALRQVEAVLSKLETK